MSTSFYENKQLLAEYTRANYRKMLREPSGRLKHRFIVPGSGYEDNLWDWDSWLTGIALTGLDGIDQEELAEYEKGCIINYLEHQNEEGQLHICITPNGYLPDFSQKADTNIHKPCLCQHASFISDTTGDYSWLKDSFGRIKKYIAYYYKNQRHESGLFVWVDDMAIGVDNDPSTFYRPVRSSASIYLNCMMYGELKAAAKIAGELDFDEDRVFYEKEAEELRAVIQRELWDERDGFYYSADVNLLPIDPTYWLHQGYPRHWTTLIQRIDCWSGFMALWSGIATKEQADRIVERYRDTRTFNSPYGVRTLGKCEKMYLIVKSGNPSCWLGPIWGISNYMVYKGLRDYGYDDDANDLAEKHLKLLGEDLKKNGCMHEYYDPETGAGVNNPGFQNWNLMGLLMEIK